MKLGTLTLKIDDEGDFNIHDSKGTEDRGYFCGHFIHRVWRGLPPCARVLYMYIHDKPGIERLEICMKTIPGCNGIYFKLCGRVGCGEIDANDTLIIWLLKIGLTPFQKYYVECWYDT